MDRVSNVGSPSCSNAIMEDDDDYFQFEANTELLDTVYYEHSVQTANQLIQTHTSWWMKKASECLTIFSDMKELLTLYNGGEAHDALLELLGKVPSFTEPPPIPQLLMHLPKAKASKRSGPEKERVDWSVLYGELRNSYKVGEPSLSKPTLPDDSEYSLQELSEKLKQCKDQLGESENFNLINAANTGNWLSLAFTRFKEDKKAGRVLSPSFDDWVEEHCGFKRAWSHRLRNFYKLCSEYPQLLRCRLALSFFTTNQRHIEHYFKADDILAARWSHHYQCSCGNCGPI